MIRSAAVRRIGRAPALCRKAAGAAWRAFTRARLRESFDEAAQVVQRYAGISFDRFGRSPYLAGRCNVCGKSTVFYCENRLLYRESLFCAECQTTSRYRSIARGVLRASRELAGVDAPSLAELAARGSPSRTLRVYDTQVPFQNPISAYPLPLLLRRCPWIEVETSLYRPARPRGEAIEPGVTNQNLEHLTFLDASFDIVITSDVMEHVRLDGRAHGEIARVLRPGGVYLFTVPHFREVRDHLIRVEVTDPDDPSKDRFLTEKEYHGDANAEDGRALSYRSYGTRLDEELAGLGFRVEYSKADDPAAGIMNTELFYCVKTPGAAS